MLTAKEAYELLLQLSRNLPRKVPGWRHDLVVWRARATDRRDGARSVLLANLCARQGRDALAVRSVFEIRHQGFRSTPRIRNLAADVEQKLRDRGYDIAPAPLPEQPLLSSRNIPIRQLRAEHLFLSDLTGKSVSPLAGRLATTEDFSKAIAAGSSWTLHESEWAMDRTIPVLGRRASAHARVRIAPPPTKGRSVSSEVSVQVWLPWNERGRQPLWLQQARTALSRQLRAGGLRAKRISAEPTLVFASRSPPRDAEELMRVAQHVGSLKLGDEA